MTDERKRLEELAVRVAQYDARTSPDNRADELLIHQDIVMETGEGSLTVEFERTYLRSLDAALTLVPEGMLVCIVNSRVDLPKPDLSLCSAIVGQANEAPTEPVTSATMALALTAAALRARALASGSPQ